MISKIIKNTFVIITLVFATALSGCGKESKKQSNESSQNMYENIHSEGASFDIRVKDKGENFYYNPANINKHTDGYWSGGLTSNIGSLVSYKIPTDNPCVFNSYLGYSLVLDGKYVYDYEKEIKPITSLTAINNSKELYNALLINQSALNPGIDFNFNGFYLASENNIISFDKFEKNDYIQIEAEVSFVTHSGSISNNGDTLFRGYIILTENKEHQSAFFFGGLEGEFSKDEMIHIKDSFVLDDSKFSLQSKELETNEVTLDFCGKKLTGEFPSLFRFEQCSIEDVDYEDTYLLKVWNYNEFHKICAIVKFIKLDKEGYTSKDYLDYYYSDGNGSWDDGGDFVGKDGKVWKKAITKEYHGLNNLEDDLDCSNEISYVCIDGDVVIDLYISAYKLNAFDDVLPLIEKALFTVSIENGESEPFSDYKILSN